MIINFCLNAGAGSNLVSIGKNFCACRSSNHTAVGYIHDFRLIFGIARTDNNRMVLSAFRLRPRCDRIRIFTRVFAWYNPSAELFLIIL